jgi:hypothetical protein
VTLYLGDVKPDSLRPECPVQAKAPAAVAHEYYTPANRAASRPVRLVVEDKK